MKFGQESADYSQQALAVIPVYPVSRWNVKSKDGEDSDALRPVKLELKTNPSSTDAVKYACWFQVFSTGTPEQFCRWQDDLQTVYRGLGLTSGPAQVGMVRHLLGGKAEDVFSGFL